MGARELSPLELSPCLLFTWGKIQVIYSKKKQGQLCLGYSWPSQLASRSRNEEGGEAKFIPSLQKAKYFTSINIGYEIFPIFSPLLDAGSDGNMS